MKRSVWGVVILGVVVICILGTIVQKRQIKNGEVTTSPFDSAQGKPPNPLSSATTSPTTSPSRFLSKSTTSPPDPLSSFQERGEYVVHDVPFMVQAPTGEWGNPIFQDGCEEVSAIMAAGLRLSSGEAKAEIEKMAKWQREKYGSAVDTSAADTARRLLNEYFKIQDSRFMIQELKTSGDIVNLLNNNILITPMDGRKLGNPYYTQPGPERHMIVITGYDPKTDELITNDGGTKRGQGYRYKRSVFWNAIRDYPTGDHEAILKIEKSAIAVHLTPGPSPDSN